MPLIDVMAAEQAHIREQVVRHKSETDRRIAKLEALVEDHTRSISDINLWRAKILGAVLVLGPISGVLTAILIKQLDKIL